MQRFGLLGRKLSHSYSPALHRSFGGYAYDLFEVDPDGLDAFMARRDIEGLNVTIPYKQRALAYCSSLSPAAQAIGSVNTLMRREDGSFFGDNTDPAGFKKMVAQSGFSAAGKKAIVIGRGGSSLSVCHALRELGAASVITVSRSENNREFLSRHEDAHLLVNATPVGMYPDTEEAPVSLDMFPRLEAALDLIYNPARTRLLMQAESLGLKLRGGLPMLAGQAAAASRIFTGREVGEEEERAAARMLTLTMENLILIGMPGCGKTSIGSLLAQEMRRPFVDADEEIAKAAGCSIPEIFRREGEAGFRLRETNAIGKIGKQSGLVIATGGGCVLRAENYALLRQNGRIIFIDRDTGKLARGGRPLSGGDLCAMREARLPLYRSFAQRTVRNDEGIKSAAKSIMEAWNEIAGD